jgi:predicted anti-sigma-YlaC factor YlaD
VRHDTRHPAQETLEAFAAEEISAGDRVVVESHLVACEHCRTAVDEWRSLFTMLAALPVYAPTARFADRVMAGVVVRSPWQIRVHAWARSGGRTLERVLPKTTRGWALASAFLALPVLVIGSLLIWLLSRSYMTGHDLWVFATDQFGMMLASAGTLAFQRFIESDLVVWLLRALGSVFEAGGAGGVGLVAAMIGAGIAASIWVLYSNLFRSPTRDANYVTYSF